MRVRLITRQGSFIIASHQFTGYQSYCPLSGGNLPWPTISGSDIA